MISVRNSRSAIGAAGFCADAGQLRVGIGKADTFCRMLEGIHRVTPSAAEAVARVYPDVRALVEAFEEYGEEVLADLPVCVFFFFYICCVSCGLENEGGGIGESGLMDGGVDPDLDDKAWEDN